MTGRVVDTRRVTAVRDGAATDRLDAVAVEEPMEIRVGGTPVAVTMRTPGHDFELALGFCLAERLVASELDVAAIRYCSGIDETTGLNTYNVVDVQTRTPTIVREDLRRRVMTTSACGLCGAASIETVRKDAPALTAERMAVPADVLVTLPDRLRAAQRGFDRTGGVHAAGLFTSDGRLVCLREDVGRHNAVDKVVGWAATQDRLPLTDHVLMVSGRVAFEIAQKALLAGIAFVAAVSAPTSLAVELTRESGMTLVGFLRGSSYNIYAGAHRIVG